MNHGGPAVIATGAPEGVRPDRLRGGYRGLNAAKGLSVTKSTTDLIVKDIDAIIDAFTK
jgi:hypothetical protein